MHLGLISRQLKVGMSLGERGQAEIERKSEREKKNHDMR